MFQFIEDKSSSRKFTSFACDYFGDMHLFENSWSVSDESFSCQSDLLYTFENQFRISALSLNPSNHHQLILGDTEGNLKLVQISESKRQKSGRNSVQLSTLIGSDNVTTFKSINQLIWRGDSRILGLGNDNSISVIEPSTLQATFRINTGHSTPLVGEVAGDDPSLTLVGFEDGYIRFFDLRSSQKKAERLFKSHVNSVSCLRGNQDDSNLFVSGALDGIAKVWDMRSDRPLYSVKIAENSKIFDVNWTGKREFLTGGDDSSITQHVMNTQ